MRFLLFVGGVNADAQQESQAFRDALQAAEYNVELVEIPGIEHNDMANPMPQKLDALAGLLRP